MVAPRRRDTTIIERRARFLSVTDRKRNVGAMSTVMTLDLARTRTDGAPVSESTERFEELYREMLPSVYRFTTARLGRAAGEDVSAEVFHAAVVAINDGHFERVTPAWLMAVARNKVIDQWRRAERAKALDHRLHRSREDLMEFPPDWANSSNRAEVMAALDQLTMRHRSLLILHYVDGMTVPELAERLDENVAALESAMARARAAFRRHYRGDEPDASARGNPDQPGGGM